MITEAEAVRLAAIDISLLVLLGIAYFYIELRGIDVTDATFVMIQLTTAIIVGTLVLIGGYIYYAQR